MTDGAPNAAARWAPVAAYATLGALLVWSRFAGLGRGGYCCDEFLTVDAYVRGGPGAILTGAYLPNNHQLFSLLSWLSSSLLGESETLLRLGSAVPFVLGVVVVTVWLHRRVGALAGALFLGLATISPLLLDLSRQARGYGLAFLAMSVLVVSALEALRSDRGWPMVGLCAGGIVGIWTLPHFAFAFAAVGLVLLVLDIRRRAVGGAFAFTVVASLAWYAPHLEEIVDSSRQEYGVPIASTWVVTASIDQTIVPAFTLLADDVLEPNLASLAFVLLFAAVMAASPLMRTRSSALVLVAPVVATIAAFWITGTNATPRFFSFLLVPLLVLVATGAAAILHGAVARRSPARILAVAPLLLVVTLASLPQLTSIPRQPRESMRELARAIESTGPPDTPVYAYVYHPGDLEAHLGRYVAQTRTDDDLRRACNQSEPVVIVTQIWLLDPISVPCARRAGTRHLYFPQYARGGGIDMWIVPPAETTT